MLAALAVICMTLRASLAAAHPLAPSLLELRELDGGKVAVRWRTPSQRAPGSELAPLLPAHCSVDGKDPPRLDGLALEAGWMLSCGSRGIAGSSVGASGIGGSGADVLLRIATADGRAMQHVLTPDAPVIEVPARQTRAQAVAAYVRLGLSHIAEGFDHLLFVLALVLLVPGRKLLVKTVTAFTLGHSLTLSLAVLGMVRVPQQIAEIGIAASLLILASELAVAAGGAQPSESSRPDDGARASRDVRASQGTPSSDSVQPAMLRRHPWMVAAGFGLLHGLGFAGALTQAGLPSRDIPLALASFNAGIELGQLLFIAAVLLVRPLLAMPAWRVLRHVPAYAIGSCAAFWVLERLSEQLY
ncbi:MAG TPA: HupE/UreJ family protein [Candidatus Binatia bacterium]|nr:HupE/UreJ family protein [Candidatus Binatia bacterium]